MCKLFVFASPVFYVYLFLVGSSCGLAITVVAVVYLIQPVFADYAVVAAPIKGVKVLQELHPVGHEFVYSILNYVHRREIATQMSVWRDIPKLLCKHCGSMEWAVADAVVLVQRHSHSTCKC